LSDETFLGRAPAHVVESHSPEAGGLRKRRLAKLDAAL